jgi:hypothetical protein
MSLSVCSGKVVLCNSVSFISQPPPVGIQILRHFHYYDLEYVFCFCYFMFHWWEVRPCYCWQNNAKRWRGERAIKRKNKKFNNSRAVVKGSSHTGLYAISMYTATDCSKNNVPLRWYGKLSLTLYAAFRSYIVVRELGYTGCLGTRV